MRPRILVVCGYEPNPITLRKIEALHTTGEWDIHLAYWRTGRARDRTPFTLPGNPASIHPIDMPPDDERPADSRGPLAGLRGSLSLVMFHRRLRRVVRDVEPDIIHASNSNMLVGSWLFCVGRPHRALIYDLLDTDEGMRRWPFVPVQRIMHRRVDHITVPSPRFVSHFLRPLGLIGDDTEPTMIANAPWSTTFADIPQRLGPAFVVGYVGSLRCPPAIQWLVESARRVRERGVNVELLFAGTGIARPLVESAAAAHSFVTYAGPYDYRTDIKPLYERLDAIYAVYEDSWDKRTHLACRLSDAVASNRAVIVASGTFMAEIVERHHLGYVVDASDPPSLEDALEDASRRRETWRSRSRIPETVRLEHTFDHYVARLRAIYSEAFRRRNSRAVHA